MKKYKNISLLCGLLLATFTASAQDKLSLQEAISTALSNNYQLKAVAVNKEIAENNATVGNAGLLPSVSLNGGGEYSNNNTEIEFLSAGGNNQQQGGGGDVPIEANRLEIDGASSINYNARVQVDYTLFDGFGNYYTFKKLKQNKELEDVKYRQQMENTVAQVVQFYYAVSRQQRNLQVAKSTMAITRDRVKRLKDQYAYGQVNKLAVLNAEVDLNTDSTKVLEAEQGYEMSLRDLNVVLGQEVNTVYAVDTEVVYQEELSAEEIMSNIRSNNASLQAQQMQVEVNQLDTRIAQAGKAPRVSAYGSYGWNQMESDASQVTYNQSIGYSAGVRLSWNLFNGNQVSTRVQNAKLATEAQQNQLNQMQIDLERRAANAWTDYEYKKRIASMEETGVERAKLNFEQTKERYELGQVTSVEFRTAQENLRMAENRLSNARYAAKISEVNLLQLAGMLIN
ncbi:TolC family protein [Algivirga pacifica]|uniref:TolC family protein n=1 Tax=Algivirga pacifica TaxID=1162670 RepID=A0ABP9DAH4_9BACT